MSIDARCRERCTQRLASFGVLAWQQPRPPHEYGHARAEALKRQCELEPNGARAEDGEVAGPACQIEDCLIGQIGHVSQSGHAR